MILSDRDNDSSDNSDIFRNNSDIFDSANNKKQNHTSINYDKQPDSTILTCKIQPSTSNLADFYIGKCMGKGAYGEVYECTKCKNGTIRALKMLDMNRLNEKKHYQNTSTEILILHSFTHPNIVKMYEWFYDDRYIYLLMEHALLGDLYVYTNKMTIRLSYHKCISYMRQLWNCMIFLRENNIIHRDIKPENILVFDYGKTIKLSDFGSSYIINDKKPFGTLVGTIYYVAPEMILNQEYDYSCDLWASGILFYEFVSGVVPNDHLSKSDEITDAIINNNIDFTLDEQINTLINVKFINIIKNILQQDPNNRPTLENCLLLLEKCEKEINNYHIINKWNNMCYHKHIHKNQKYNTF